jgi:hypothetical protein
MKNKLRGTTFVPGAAHRYLQCFRFPHLPH